METKKQSHIGYYVLGASGLVVASVGAVALNQNGKKNSGAACKSSSTAAKAIDKDVTSFSKKIGRNWGKAGIGVGLLSTALVAGLHPKGQQLIQKYAPTVKFGKPVPEIVIESSKRDVWKIATYALGGLATLGLIASPFAAKALRNSARHSELTGLCENEVGQLGVFATKDSETLMRLLNHKNFKVHHELLKVVVQNKNAEAKLVKAVFQKAPDALGHDPVRAVDEILYHVPELKPEVLRALLDHIHTQTPQELEGEFNFLSKYARTTELLEEIEKFYTNKGISKSRSFVL